MSQNIAIYYSRILPNCLIYEILSFIKNDYVYDSYRGIFVRQLPKQDARNILLMNIHPEITLVENHPMQNYYFGFNKYLYGENQKIMRIKFEHMGELETGIYIRDLYTNYVVRFGMIYGLNPDYVFHDCCRIKPLLLRLLEEQDEIIHSENIYCFSENTRDKTLVITEYREDILGNLEKVKEWEYTRGDRDTYFKYILVRRMSEINETADEVYSHKKQKIR